MTATMDRPETVGAPEAPTRRARRPRRTPKRGAPRRPQPTARSVADRPASAAEETASVLSTSFTMIGIVCLWIAVQLLFLSSVSQSRSQDLLYDQLRQQLAGATAPVGPVVPAGAPVALMTVPDIGLQQVVVEGTASGDLLAGPGHRRDTALPGQVGTSVVYGRAATYGGPFGDLPSLGRGAEITVVGGQGEKTFRVVGVRRAGDPLPQPPADGAARLTLVTAEGEGRLGALAPRSVVYVDADAKKGFPAPSGRAAAVPESEQAMSNDTGALPLLALCLALLLAVTLGVIAARQRWSAALVWVVASPLVIALSWATTDVVMRLLPNLI
ncbi:class E sortase [Nocardioides sp. LMS-CY]|uniref:class E sortase n=1 Tax=Nocardioides sp. (strain LMS-CY) TaxID=2840457 RepID=UPI001C0046C1|nr:class E sortase [Nocardioides sp. LMS-CY]QWF21422.1 class E sortase [Nocardioides sp. LMS-CY]